MIGRAPRPLPIYGSAEWHRLPEDDYARIAAVVTAAECWARHGDDLERELRDEVAALRADREAVERDAFAATAREVRARAGSPSHAAVAERRGDHGEAARARLRAVEAADVLGAARASVGGGEAR